MCIIDGYCIPVSVLHHRKELRVVQVWHALGAIKKFGRQALSVPGGRDKELAERMGMHKHYDAVLQQKPMRRRSAFLPIKCA